MVKFRRINLRNGPNYAYYLFVGGRLEDAKWTESRYIDWRRESAMSELGAEEFTAKLKEVQEGFTKLAMGKGKNTLRSAWTAKTYSLKKDKYSITLYTFDGEKYERFALRIKKVLDAQPVTGGAAMKAVVRKNMELNGMGLTKGWGVDKWDLRICIPKAFFFLNDGFKKDHVYKHVSQIDGSSQYAGGSLGILPDSHGAIEVLGQAEPSPEYPFAFYVNSGHMKILNEFDTRDWLNGAWWDVPFKKEQRPFLSPKEDKTILMKASKMDFAPVMLHFYKQKEECPRGSYERQLAKTAINAFFGMLHKSDYGRTYYPFAHVAAVILGRATQSIIAKATEVGRDRILQIAVDGIVYAGSDSQADAEAGLGKYRQEVLDARFLQMGMNHYAFEKDGAIVKQKHGAFNAYAQDDGTLIDAESAKLIELSDVKRFCRSQSMQELLNQLNMEEEQ